MLSDRGLTRDHSIDTAATRNPLRKLDVKMEPAFDQTSVPWHVRFKTNDISSGNLRAPSAVLERVEFSIGDAINHVRSFSGTSLI